MPRSTRIAKMPIDALIKLRDSIGAALNERAVEIRKQLASLSGVGKRGRKRGSALRGRKVPAKYRSRKNPKLTWSGRGALPRWMREEMKARKLKKEAFLIK